MEFTTEICICGHPVNRHVLLDTEYTQCRTFPTPCHCYGGVRISLVVSEAVEHPSAVQTNGRHFRKRFDLRRGHSLNEGVSQVREAGIEYAWVDLSCDGCAVEFIEGEEPRAYYVDSSGKAMAKVSEITGRSTLLCAMCSVIVESNG
jgi:hypothetical protein